MAIGNWHMTPSGAQWSMNLGINPADANFSDDGSIDPSTVVNGDASGLGVFTPGGIAPPTPTAAAPGAADPDNPAGDPRAALAALGANVDPALRAEVNQHLANVAHLSQQQLDEAKASINQQQLGPSLSERLFAISAALAQRTDQRGLGGVLGNVMPTVSKYADAARQARTARAQALAALQSKYTDQQIASENAGLGTTLKLAQISAAQAKANEPKMEMDQQGNVHMVTPYAALPHTRTEADVLALPPGKQYIDSNGLLQTRFPRPGEAGYVAPPKGT
jgi:hypothetical protein